MKNSSITLLRAAVAAAVLTFTAGAASAATLVLDNSYLKGVFTDGNFGLASNVNAGVREITYGKVTSFVFCIEPTTVLTTGTSYLAKQTSVKASVANLYNSSYASIMSGFSANTADHTGVAAFQLALWELQNDDGNLSSGLLKFTSSSKLNQATVKEAQTLLTAAADYTGKNKYYFYKLDGATSQDLLQVSPVPEADTWAMLVAGLGFVGFMARRRKAA